MQKRTVIIGILELDIVSNVRRKLISTFSHIKKQIGVNSVY